MKLLAIDSNSIINRAYYGVRPLTTKDGVYTNGIYGFFNIFLKICDEVSPDAVAFAFDLKAPTFRHRQFADYKAGRKGMPEELAMQLPYLKDLISALGYRVITCEGYEADDILGTFARSCAEMGCECVIATGDRDSLQLVDEKVTVRLATTKMGRPESVIYNIEAVQEKYGVTPHELIAVKALMGDASDNIPGVAGIGEKTALALIAKYHSIDEVYAHIDDEDMKPAVRKKLLDGKEMCYTSLALAEIFCSVPIDADPENYRPQPIDTALCSSIMTRLELFSLMKKLGIPEGLSAEGGDEISAGEPPSALSVAKGDLASVEKLSDDAAELFAIFEYEGDNICALSMCDGSQILEMAAADPDFERCCEILQASGKLVTSESKLLYRSGFVHGRETAPVLFDAQIAAYLLSPSSTSYSLERLSAEYQISPCTAEGELSAQSQQLVRLIPLCALLRQRIEQLGQNDLLYKIEQPLTEVLASMEIVGFDLDTEGLAAFGDELDRDLAKYESAIYEMAGENFNINSPKQLAVILFEKLELPARKKTKSGYSTNAEVLEELRDKHPIIDNILGYRKLAKLKSTYVDGLLKVVGPDGRVHTSFQQTETRTGRISSTEPNMQNIPVRTEIGSNLRKFFHAEGGSVLVDADYSQIELRVLAHIADDKNMIEAFKSGEDIHTQTAAQVFNLPPMFVTPLMRSRAKAVNFGIVYGIGAFSLAHDIGVSLSEADTYIKNYLETYSGVRTYMENTKRSAAENGYVSTLFGRRRDLPELAASNRVTRAAGERIAMNTPIQGTAADIIKIAMVRVYNRLKAEKLEGRLILQVHDELIIECPEGESEIISALLKQEMEQAAQLSVPMIVDVGVGKTWYESK